MHAVLTGLPNCCGLNAHRLRASALVFGLAMSNLLACQRTESASSAGCKSDAECKGDRLCKDAVCVDPSPSVAQQAPSTSGTAAPEAAAVVPATPAPVAASKPKGPVPVSDPPGGCELDGVTYDASGRAWGCAGGGNWCKNTPPLPGGCPVQGSEAALRAALDGAKDPAARAKLEAELAKAMASKAKKTTVTSPCKCPAGDPLCSCK